MKRFRKQLAKSTRGRGRPKKAKPIQIEITLANGDLFTTTVQSQRELAGLVFEDIRGRKRLYVEGDPLLSNLDGPAVIYPDGEEDFFINGRPAELYQMPGFGDMIDHDTEVLWQFDTFQAIVGRAVIMREEANSWTIDLQFLKPSNLTLAVKIGIEDIRKNSAIWMNDLEMKPEQFFDTLEFAHRLLDFFTGIKPDRIEYEQVLLPIAAEKVERTITDLLMAEQKSRIDDKIRGLDKMTKEASFDDLRKRSNERMATAETPVKFSEVELDKIDAAVEACEKQKSDSGLGKVMMAGLAAAGTVGAMALLGSSAGKTVKQVATVRA